MQLLCRDARCFQVDKNHNSLLLYFYADTRSQEYTYLRLILTYICCHHLQLVVRESLSVQGRVEEDVPGGSVDREGPTVVLHGVLHLVVGRVVLVPGGHAGHKPGQLLPILYPWLVLPVLSSSVSFSTCS